MHKSFQSTQLFKTVPIFYEHPKKNSTLKNLIKEKKFMCFEVTFYHSRDTNNRRKSTVIMIADNFQDCLHRALVIYGKNLCKIVYDPKKNEV